MGLAGAAAKEDFLVSFVVHQRPHLLRQTPLGNHFSCDIGRSLNVVGRTGSYTVLAQRHFLGDTAAEQAANLAGNKAPAMAVAVLFRQEHGHTKGATPGDNTDLVYRVVLRQQAANNGMPRFVVGSIALLVLRHDHGFALGAHHDLVLCLFKLGHAHRANSGAGGKQSGLVDQVRQVSA